MGPPISTIVSGGVSFDGPYQSIDRLTGEFNVNANTFFHETVNVKSDNSQNNIVLRTDDMIAGNQSASLILNNFINQPSIRMYGNAGENKGFMELRYDGGKTIELDASNNSGGEILLFGPAKQVEIQSNSSVTTGGRIRLFNKAGSPRLVLDSEYGNDGLARIICDELEIRGGADVTEAFDINAPILPEPGMLVCVDENNIGDLTICSESFDTKVIGVVSGANGIRPGMKMSQQGSIADGEYPIAVTGRVFVKANDNNGKILPGDFLTTSTQSGYAMKAGKDDEARGSIVGKALSGIVDGYVLILVSLQ